jgi:hypothetical protein
MDPSRLFALDLDSYQPRLSSSTYPLLPLLPMLRIPQHQQA